MTITLRPQEGAAGHAWTAAELEATRRVIERRAQSMAAGISSVTAVSPDKIVLEARTMPTPEEVERLTSPYSLRFYLLPQLDSGSGSAPPKWSVAKDSASNEILTQSASGAKVSDAEMEGKIFSRRPDLAAEDFLPEFKSTVDQQGHPFLEFRFKDVATVKFAQIAAQHTGAHLAVFLDHKLITAPTINAPIPGKGVIEAAFTPDEAYRLAQVLNTGALPAPLTMTFARSDK